MLDICNDQLLMLLLVVGAHLHQLHQCFRRVTDAQDVLDVFVNVMSVGQHFIQRRTGESVPQRLVRLWPQAVVVGIKKRLEAIVKRPVAVQMLRQNKSLKEPAGVGEMPFRGTGFCAGLHHRIFRSQRRRQSFGLFPHRSVLAGWRLPGSGLDGHDWFKRRHNISRMPGHQFPGTNTTLLPEKLHRTCESAPLRFRERSKGFPASWVDVSFYLCPPLESSFTSTWTHSSSPWKNSSIRSSKGKL